MSTASEQTNAVIYARYSSHGQQEQSIDGQLRDCCAFAERQGYTIVAEYIDRALTGRNDDRPDFQRMLADAKKKQFKYIIVWKLDRFARNRYDSAVHKAELKKCGVRVISATENITDEPEGIMLEGLLESLAEYYSANLSKHVKRGQRESILKGNVPGGVPPYGFKLVDKKLVADEEKAPIIRYIFEEYAKGTPKKAIFDELNARGIKNAYGKPFTFSSLQNNLRNPKYIGKFVYAGEEVKDCCEALVSEEVFNAVQARLDHVKHSPAAGKAHEEYLLQGKAFCGHCGAPLVGESGRGRGGLYHYYACAEKKKRHTCTKKNEKKGFLEWYVVEQTVEYVLTPERIDYIAARIVEKYDEEFNNKKIKDLERQAQKIEGEINSAVDASLKAPEKVRPRYYEKIETLETQKADIELNISTLKIAAGHSRYSKEQIAAWLKTFCNGDNLDINFQKRIIDVLVNSVYVYDDKIVIYYNVKGGKQVSYMEMCDNIEGLDAGAVLEDSGGGVRISNTPPRQPAAGSYLSQGPADFCISLEIMGNLISLRQAA